LAEEHGSADNSQEHDPLNLNNTDENIDDPIEDELVESE